MIRSLVAIAAVTLSAAASAETGWAISEAKAAQIVLDAYPGILRNAYVFGPVQATLQSEVRGFAHKGQKVWHVRIHCNSGGPHATFFVHPDTGSIYSITEPNGADSVKCK